MSLRRILLSALLVPAAAGVAAAQQARAATVYSDSRDDGERPMIGVSTNSSGIRDTLGLLITSITPGGPAEKAGLEEGNRIASINGVNLRVNREDAGQSDMSGLTTRRLTREIQKVKPGDEVELRVWSDGQYRNVKVKTVAAEDMPGYRSSTMVRGGATRLLDRDALKEQEDNRAVVGLQLNSTGTRRDTLGALIIRVEPNGPAEKAGLTEGDRVAAINGVNIRVSPEDAGDPSVASARVSRFTREMRKLSAGDEVELQVYSAGQRKTLRLKTLRAKEVYTSERDGNVRYFFGGSSYSEAPFAGTFITTPIAPLPPLPPAAPIIVGPRSSYQINSLDRIDRMIDEVRARAEAQARLGGVQAELRARAAEEAAAARAARDMLRGRISTIESAAPAPALAPAAPLSGDDRGALEAERDRLQAEVNQLRREAAVAGSTARSASWVGGASAAFYGPASTVALNGMRLRAVSADLAAYLGRGSDDGLLVLEAADRYPAIHEGDVLLSVNGKAVRSGANVTVSLSSTQDNDVELLRNGKQMRVTVR